MMRVMAKEPIAESGKNNEANNFGVIFATIGDTTWRMFVPTVGFTLLGVWLDGVFGLKPWLMFGGIVIGFLGAYALVAHQMGMIKRKDERR
jgi:hypothetical protein